MVTKTFEKRLGTLTRKEVDDVLGGKDTWENVDQLTVDGCARCGNKRAYFMQIQIRSADEPMTIFFKCVECAYQWREN
jgi:DNA-directed RNA polymerase III subunit RPC11